MALAFLTNQIVVYTYAYFDFVIAARIQTFTLYLNESVLLAWLAKFISFKNSCELFTSLTITIKFINRNS